MERLAFIWPISAVTSTFHVFGDRFGSIFKAGYTLSLISGKWKMIILYLLSKSEPIRYNEMHRLLGSMTYKTLSVQFKELEADHLIYPQGIPTDSPQGRVQPVSTRPIILALCHWVKDQQAQDENQCGV